MPQNVFQNGASLFRVIENAPVPHLEAFLLQGDDNFLPVRAALGTIFDGNDEMAVRSKVVRALGLLSRDEVAPVEVECQRVLGLTETKGPTSLRTIVERQLSSEEYDEFDEQPDDYGRSLWAHVHHRRCFDDAVSFKAIRSWRNADRLFAAFNVDLDGKGKQFNSVSVDTGKLKTAIAKKLKSSRALAISLIDLPEVPEYPPSVLAIVRFAGQQSSVATHGERGERKIIYYLPQDEAVLIYTPTDERIEVAARRAAVRNAVAECFAVETLGQDLSTKPLTSAVYDTRQFLQSVDLTLPEIANFTVVSAKVIDLELRIENWQSRLALKAGGRAEMSDLVMRYLHPGKVLRRALGVGRVLIAIQYEQKDDTQRKVLEIMISDRNSSSLNSEHDPALRNFGRKLLVAWGILRAFRDLDEQQANDLVPVMAELWELGQKTQPGDYFASRGIATGPLEDALLIRKKEVTPKLIEEDDDEDVEGPSETDRTIYAIDLEWVQDRLKTALKGVIDTSSVQELRSGLTCLGVMRIDDREVPCYLARNLDQMNTFATIDVALRARSGAGPGIVFTGKSDGADLIGANVVVPLVSGQGSELRMGADRDAIVRTFHMGRSLALGVGSLELIEEPDHSAARLHFPDRDPLDLFGEHAVRAFRLLVEAAGRGAPGVRSRDLIDGSGSTGFEQMIGTRRWPIVKTYVESSAPRWWKLKGY